MKSQDNFGRQPIHHALKSGYKKTISLLFTDELSKKIDFDCKTIGGLTPLMIAAKQGDHYSVRKLLRAGANYAAEDTQSKKAEDYAMLVDEKLYEAFNEYANEKQHEKSL